MYSTYIWDFSLSHLVLYSPTPTCHFLYLTVLLFSLSLSGKSSHQAKEGSHKDTQASLSRQRGPRAGHGSCSPYLVLHGDATLPHRPGVRHDGSWCWTTEGPTLPALRWQCYNGDHFSCANFNSEQRLLMEGHCLNNGDNFCNRLKSHVKLIFTLQTLVSYFSTDCLTAYEWHNINYTCALIIGVSLCSN